MRSTDREKMCGQCEGRVPFDATQCPFCASPVDGLPKEYQPSLFESKSLKDSLVSLYTPPYLGKEIAAEERPSLPKQPPAQETASAYRDVTREPFRDVAAEELAMATEHQEEELGKSSLWPTLLLVGGSNLFLLSLMQLFFSKGGILRLEWDASYWLLYLLAALPMLYFGMKKCKELS